MRRRTLLQALVVTLGTALAGALGWLAALFGISSAQGRPSGSRKWVALCSLAEIPEKEPLARSFRFQRLEGWYWQEVTRQVYVGRDRQGAPVVFSRRCTHLGCPVHWSATSSTFRCRCHGGVFTQLGEVEGGPPPRALDRVRHRISGEVLEVEEA
jgi:menaquinol-cytochrome c reductase iron-sulfur subunit